MPPVHNLRQTNETMSAQGMLLFQTYDVSAANLVLACQKCATLGPTAPQGMSNPNKANEVLFSRLSKIKLRWYFSSKVRFGEEEAFKKKGLKSGHIISFLDVPHYRSASVHAFTFIVSFG